MANRAVAKTNGNGTGIIAGAAELNKALNRFRTMYVKVGDMAHSLFISVLDHAARHGDPGPLTDFVNILRTNDRQAAILYIRRVHAALGGWDGEEGIAAEIMQGYVENGAFLVASRRNDKTEFRVIKNSRGEHIAKAKEQFSVLATEKLIEPDGKVWRRFMDRNNISELRKFGRDDLLRGLQTLISRADGDTASVESEVPEDDIRVLTEAYDTIKKLPPPPKLTQEMRVAGNA